MPSTLIEKVKEAARRLGVRRFWRERPTPTNQRIFDASEAAISEAINYGFGLGSFYLDALRDLGVDIRNAKILEIGPGPAFGSMAVLQSFGAKVFVADRWLAPWQDDFHPQYYLGLAMRIENELNGCDTDLLKRMAKASTYDQGVIELIDAPAEKMTSVLDNSFDVIVSNAVLEHVANPTIAFAELYRVTENGGIGLHQVDFRDHRDFARPLDHLLFSADSFRALSERVNTEYGSQMRQNDYARLLSGTGFEILSYESNDWATAEYMQDFMPRLREAVVSPYNRSSEEDIADLSGRFILRCG